MAPPKTDAPALEGQVSIEDFLSADFDKLVEGEEQVSLGGDRDATWALQKLAALRKQLAANNDLAEAEANRIAAWLEAVNEPLRRQVQFVEGILNGYAIHERTAHDRKTIILPYGKLSTRPGQEKWEVADPDAFIRWAEESGHKDLLKVTTKPESLTVIKAALAATDDGEAMLDGELVPGVTVTKPTAPTVNITTI